MRSQVPLVAVGDVVARWKAAGDFRAVRQGRAAHSSAAIGSLDSPLWPHIQNFIRAEVETLDYGVGRRRALALFRQGTDGGRRHRPAEKVAAGESTGLAAGVLPSRGALCHSRSRSPDRADLI